MSVTITIKLEAKADAHDQLHEATFHQDKGITLAWHSASVQSWTSDNGVTINQSVLSEQPDYPVRGPGSWPQGVDIDIALATMGHKR